MKYGVLLLLIAACQSLLAESSVVEIGKQLPLVALAGEGVGELEIVGQQLDYTTWSSTSMEGRAHMLYIVAARMGIDKVNQSLLDALEEEGAAEAFPAHTVSVLSMINIGDVFPFGGTFARRAFEAARMQPENQHAIFVLDDDSKVQRAWGLKRGGAAVIIVDQEGKVVRFKDGALTEEEVVDYVSVLRRLRDDALEQKLDADHKDSY